MKKLLNGRKFTFISVVTAIAAICGIIFGINAYESKFMTEKDYDALRKDITLIVVEIHKLKTGAVQNKNELENSIYLVKKELSNRIRSNRIYLITKRIRCLEDEYGGEGIPTASNAIKEYYDELKWALKNK